MRRRATGWRSGGSSTGSSGPFVACKEISSVNICLFQQRQAVLSSGPGAGVRPTLRGSCDQPCTGQLSAACAKRWRLTGKPRVMMERLHPPPPPPPFCCATTTADMPACRLCLCILPAFQGRLQPFAAMSEREGLQHARAIRRQLEQLRDSGAAARLIIDAKELRIWALEWRFAVFHASRPMPPELHRCVNLRAAHGGGWVASHSAVGGQCVGSRKHISTCGRVSFGHPTWCASQPGATGEVEGC